MNAISDDMLQDIWDKHHSVPISPAEASRQVNADVLAAMREAAALAYQAGVDACPPTTGSKS